MKTIVIREGHQVSDTRRWWLHQEWKIHGINIGNTFSAVIVQRQNTDNTKKNLANEIKQIDRLLLQFLHEKWKKKCSKRLNKEIYKVYFN